jgi:hypothetical protein
VLTAVTFMALNGLEFKINGVYRSYIFPVADPRIRFMPMAHKEFIVITLVPI